MILLNLLFIACWLWIGFVSSIDNYLVVKYRSDMPTAEQNPVARYIMTCDNWDVSSFVGIKMFCTIFVLGLLAIIYCGSKSVGFRYAAILAAFQAALFLYLIYA